MSFNGKAIYNPSGKAGEYSYWACNFFVGCSNGCTYCYLKKGILAGVMGQDKPQLKKCFKDENHALEVFEKELKQNIVELQKHGLFFTFTSDPFLSETIELTERAMELATDYDVPVKLLTKRADWLDRILPGLPINERFKKLYTFGFTITGRDDKEPGASTNIERIDGAKRLHKAGFKTFASFEPIIELETTYDMILLTLRHNCIDLYKIGLQSGKKYDKDKLLSFISRVLTMVVYAAEKKVYFKDSLLKAAGISRESLPSNCVTRDFNLYR